MPRLGTKPRQRRNLMQTLETENIVVLTHRKRFKAALIGNAHLLDQRRH